MGVMELDPHTLHIILQRIRQQMRCPQCGEKVPVEFTAVRLTGDDFLLLQLKCDVCDAYIVLHASLQGLKLAADDERQEKGLNISTCLCSKDVDVTTIRDSLRTVDGSLSSLFESQPQKPQAKRKPKT